MLSKSFIKAVIEFLESEDRFMTFLQDRGHFISANCDDILSHEKRLLELLSEKDLRAFFRCLESIRFNVQTLPNMEAVLLKSSRDEQFLQSFLLKRSQFLTENGLSLSHEEVGLFDSIPAEAFLQGVKGVSTKANSFHWDEKIPVIGLALLLFSCGYGVWKSTVMSFGIRPDNGFEQMNRNRKWFLQARGSEIATYSFGSVTFSDAKFVATAEVDLSFRGELPSNFQDIKETILEEIRREMKRSLCMADLPNEVLPYVNDNLRQSGTPTLNSCISFSFAVEKLLIKNLELKPRSK